jgi:hypothetical protein
MAFRAVTTTDRVWVLVQPKKPPPFNDPLEVSAPAAWRWVTSRRRFDDCGPPFDNCTVMERGEVAGRRDAMLSVRL